MIIIINIINTNTVHYIHIIYTDSVLLVLHGYHLGTEVFIQGFLTYGEERRGKTEGKEGGERGGRERKE